MSLWRALIFTSIGVVGFLSNTFIIAVLIKFPSLMSADSQKLILNQCIIDAVTSLCLLTSHRTLIQNFGITDYSYRDDYVLDETLCRLWQSNIFLWAFIIASTFNLMVVTVERYLSLVHPMWYKTRATPTMINLALALPWILGPAYEIGFYIILMDVKDNRCQVIWWTNPTTGQILGILTVVIQFFLPIFLLVFCYIRILNVIRSRWSNLSAPSEALSGGSSTSNTSISMVEKSQSVTSLPNESQSECPSQSEEDADDTTKTEICTVSSTVQNSLSYTNKTTKASQLPTPSTSSHSKGSKVTATERLMEQNAKIQQKIIKTLVLVSVAYFLCWVCNQTTFFLSNVGVMENNRGTPFYDFSIIMVYLNICINPFIYIQQYKKFRQILRWPCKG